MFSRACALLIAVALGMSGVASAAEPARLPLSYDAAAAETASIRRYEIEVGEVARHVLRLYETRRVFTR